MTPFIKLFPVLLAGVFCMGSINAADAGKREHGNLSGEPFEAGKWYPLFPSIHDPRPEKWVDSERITNVYNPQIQYFFPKGWKKSDKRPLICIFPGGGYSIEAMTHEGTSIAEWFNSMGMVAAIVKYRVSKDDLATGAFPGPLLDARKAIRLSRAHTGALGIAPNKIGVIGFSAGGHLAGMATTLWGNKLEQEKGDSLASVSARPDFSMLIYPVITMNDAFTHKWSKTVITGKKPSKELIELCSPEKQVTSKTPPVFLVHAKDDFVSPKNSELMEEACRKHGVRVTKKIYESGGHGYGIMKRNKPTDEWPKDATAWLQSLSLIPVPQK